MKIEDIYTSILERLSEIENDRIKLEQVLAFLKNINLQDDEPQNITEIPEEYDDLILQITDAVSNGFVSFLNPDTFEIEQSADVGLYDSREYQEQNEDMIDEFGLSYAKWDNYIKFEPANRNEWFNKMTRFISSINDQKVKSKLEDVNDREEYITNFNEIIEQTGRTEDWLTFSRKDTETYVKNQLMQGLTRRVRTDENLYE